VLRIESLYLVNSPVPDDSCASRLIYKHKRCYTYQSREQSYKVTDNGISVRVCYLILGQYRNHPD